MTIHIGKPLAILMLAALGGGVLLLFVQELPDLIRYVKQVEGL